MQTETLTEQKTALELFQLTEFLEAFLPIVDSRIPTRVNAGGCGIFAKYLHENLSKMGFDSKIVYVGEYEDKDELEYLVHNNKFKGRCGVAHCLVSISDYIFLDSDGVQVSPELKAQHSTNVYYGGVISDEVLDTLIANIDSWNPMFDRDCEQNIKDELGKMAEEFENFKNHKFDMKLCETTKYSKHTVKYLKMEKMAEMTGGLPSDLIHALMQSKKSKK